MNKELHPASTALPEGGMIPFSFAPNSTSAVDQSTIVGLDFIESVTRSDVGVFDIVLKGAVDSLWYVPSVRLATDADVTISSWNYAPTTNTLTIRVRSGGSAADISANASNVLGGVIFYTNSSLPY